MADRERDEFDVAAWLWKNGGDPPESGGISMRDARAMVQDALRAQAERHRGCVGELAGALAGALGLAAEQTRRADEIAAEAVSLEARAEKAEAEAGGLRALLIEVLDSEHVSEAHPLGQRIGRALARRDDAGDTQDADHE